MIRRKIISNSYNSIIRTTRILNELYWAQIYNSTTQNSSWLTENNFSPGRWAVGYNFLYVMYRILTEKKPSHILELGLGQTTKMIGQYARSNSDVTHIIIEEDKDWITFFEGMFHLPENSRIIQHDYEYTVFKGKKDVRTFAGFTAGIQDKKFDFIMIDAPKGSASYSRVDILKVIPQCLQDSFIIILDDYERKGEQKTIKEVLKVLDTHNIKYVTGVYSGEKDVIVITSEDNKFLCSL